MDSSLQVNQLHPAPTPLQCRHDGDFPGESLQW